MIDIQQKKEGIISFLRINGPSLPVRIARAIEMEPMFASAILSELLNEKRIKMSHMKIGASALYLLPNQEQKLEDHTDNLKSIEKEAYLKLKERKVLVDSEEEPAIRVALRNLKDFASPFKQNEKIIWKYVFSQNEEIEKVMETKNDNENIKSEIIGKKSIVKEFKEKEKSVQKSWENPINKASEEKTKEKNKQPPKIDKNKIENIFGEKSKEEKPEFLNEVKKFLKEKNIEFLEEIKTEKKEVVAKVNIKTILGDINFLLIAKNKLTTNIEEINSAIQIAKYNKMPCILIIRKVPTKNILKFLENNYLIKLEVMEN